MLIRALIVLLVVLNLGVAAWWITQPPSVPPKPVAMPAGVARLQLLEENLPVKPAPASASVSPALAPVAAPAEVATEIPEAAPAAIEPAPQTPPAPVAAVVTAPSLQCFTLGPFTNAGTVAAAGSRISGLVSRSRTDEHPGKSASAYNVILPPAADREAAQALAQRIGAAGFDDFLVIARGDQANGIALGRYGSREAAQRRQAALKAAGFPAQLQAMGEEGASQWWLQVLANAGSDEAQLKRIAGAAQVRSLDCAGLR